jgi:hypothetical protein
MSWVFTTSWTALLPLVAALRNPTVRLRYSAARDVLAEHRLSSLHPQLLGFLGSRDLAAERVEHHLNELARTFDIASGAASSRFPFSTDITPIARPAAIDGIRAEIRRGNHREVVFWLVATYCRCHKILAADAPALGRGRAGAFAAMLADLGLGSTADLAGRAEATIAFLPTLWEATEVILAKSPGWAAGGRPRSGPRCAGGGLRPPVGHPGDQGRGRGASCWRRWAPPHPRRTETG